jgi:Papain-like cysteine protease AvrRpt2
MRTNMKRTVGLCIALCLGLTSACVQVDVSVTSQDNSRASSPYPPMKPSISMDDLKKLHTKKSCNPSSWDVAKEQQQTAAWCWAASTRMVMEYHNKEQKKPTNIDSQCNIVMNILSNLPRSTNCCEKQEGPDFIDAPLKCRQGGWPHWVLEEYGFSYETVGTALDWEALTGEICSTGPFISVIEWRGGGQHAFVVKGYHEPKDKDFKPSPLAPSPLQFVEVYDPNLDDHLDMTLDEFVGDAPKKEYEYQPFSHTLDFVQIRPKAKDKP